jgi:hypothetical protein
MPDQLAGLVNCCGLAAVIAVAATALLLVAMRGGRIQ